MSSSCTITECSVSSFYYLWRWWKSKDFEISSISSLIGHFRNITYSAWWWGSDDKNNRNTLEWMWNYLHIIHFSLSLSSLPHYQAEFNYIEKGLLPTSEDARLVRRQHYSRAKVLCRWKKSWVIERHVCKVSEICNRPIAARRDCDIKAAWFWASLFCSYHTLSSAVIF